MKKHSLYILACLLLLAGCSSNAEHCPTLPVSGPWESDPDYMEAIAITESDSVYIPQHVLSPYEVVEAYFEQHYQSYITNTPIDLCHILDTNQRVVQNMTTWTRLLLQRRRLIAEHDLAYVETRPFPYEIAFQDEVDDQRMEYWSERGQDPLEEEVILHFVITGEAGAAYPPLMAVNTLHTMRLMRVDDQWKITFHYFPGAIRKYYWRASLTEISDEACLALLLEEFAEPTGDPAPASAPANAKVYNGEKAARYALDYTEAPNPNFYHIGDWMGNCANFTSQSVWYGFSADHEPSVSAMENMTQSWYAGAGGGSPAWENVGYFWNYITEGRALTGQQLSSITELIPGDVVQTRTSGRDDDEGFSHSLMLVNSETLMLAQNSPGCFVYYSDLVNVETRLVRPVSLQA